MTLSATEKAVFRHYYRKLKKLTRKGGLRDGKAESLGIGGVMPDMAWKDQATGLLWRGTGRREIEKLAGDGRFVSQWSHELGKSRTYTASLPRRAAGYAESKSEPRVYAISPAAFKRSDERVRQVNHSPSTTAPIRGGIFRHEVRGILKGSDGGVDKYGRKKLRWRPASLGDVQNRNFSARLRLRELAFRSGMASLTPSAGL